MTPNSLKPWQPQRTVDDAIDAYADWRDECRAVRDAYARWVSAPSADAGALFELYSAALEREELAAEVYAVRVRGVNRRGGSGVETETAPGDQRNQAR